MLKFYLDIKILGGKNQNFMFKSFKNFNEISAEFHEIQ